MDLWYPPDDEAPLLEWWTPLLLAASAARREQIPWPIHLDDFQLMGRVDRGARPAVWIYKHRGSRRELNLDSTGRAYKFTRTPNAVSYGRFTACRIRQAIFLADLPTFVEPVWYDEPPRRPVPPWPGSDPPEPLDEPVEPAPTPSASHPTRRRRPRAGARRDHLTLIQGGRAAG
jgi:hypothetical protein